MEINTEVLNGTAYHRTEIKGVGYTLSRTYLGEWQLISSRITKMSQVRFFESLEIMESALKPLKGISALLP